MHVVEARSFSKAAETLDAALVRHHDDQESGTAPRHSALAAKHAHAQPDGGDYISSSTGRPLDWHFNVNGEPLTMTTQSRYAVNETEAYLQCGIEGLGIIQLSEFVAKPYLESGRLREVLAGSRSTPVPVSMLYPHRNHASAAVKAFVDWVAEIFRQCVAQ